MSRRLLNRGRYPKGPGVEQVANTNSQFPQNPPATTSQIPYYDPSLQPQTSQNSWSQPQPLYSNSNTYQPNQVNHPTYHDPNAYQPIQAHHQPVAESASYWSGSQMHTTSQAPWNDSWNYKPETAPDNTSFANYQQPAIPPVTEQWQNAPYPQTTNLNYPQQSATNYDQTYQPGYQHPSHEYPTTNNNSNVIPPNSTPPWENGGLETAQPDQLQWASNTNQYSNTAPVPVGDVASTTSWTAEANSFVPSSGLDYNASGTTNYLYNSENLSATTSGNGSRNPSPSVEGPETIHKDLQATNEEPVYGRNSPRREQSDFECASSMLAAFFQSPDPEVLSSQLETVPTDSAPIATVELSSQKDVSPEGVGVSSVVCNQPDIPGVVSEDLRAIANQPDIPGVVDDPRLITNPPDIIGVVNQTCESRFIDNSTADLGMINIQSDVPSQIGNLSDLRPLSSQPDNPQETVKQTNDSDNERNFLQEERMLEVALEENPSSNSISPAGFIEEPINQEVPEPHRNESPIVQPPSAQDHQEITAEDPPNQQIPTRSGQTSRSTSSERERVVIRPREDSPFKPPRPSSSKGIVQQEISIHNQLETKPIEGKSIVQEVNLETFPDNLERPSDYEELRKQSPLYVSRKHLRSELNSSPSSLLCDNLDIPCVTLAPAAPPLSSAKSDRSESSTDSKSENLKTGASLSSFKFTEQSSHHSSASDIREDIYRKPKDQKAGRNEAPNTLPSQINETTRTSRAQNNTSSIPVAEEKSDLGKKEFYQPPVYLKDSKVNGSNPGNGRDTQHLRQAVSNSEIPTSKIPPSRNPLREPEYHSEEMINSRYPPSDHSESSRQRFADHKYPSYDDRQYYSDRERSRPSSRNSSRDRPEEFPYQPNKPDDYSYSSSRGDPRRHPADHGRPSSRMSNESDTRHSDRQGYSRQSYGYPPAGAYRGNPDYYQRPPPNQRGYERDYDPYQRDPYYSSYYDAYRYAYSNYNYGFYDEFYRNDPRYKQYQEQCRQYYAKYGHEVDYERSSVHSGRSSVNELSKEVPRSGHYQEPDIDSNESEFSGYNLNQNYSYDDGQNEISNTEAVSTPSSRLTPVKFSYPHPIARFSPGGMLITAIPNQMSTGDATTIRIHNLQVIREGEDSFKELKNYQGPLVRGLTHKNDVIEFCTQKMKNINCAEDIVDRDSHTLLWELMVLLLRQNGSVAGSDIAELLLKDHEVLRPPPLPQGVHSPADMIDSSSQSHTGDASSPDEGIVVLHDKTVVNTSGTVNVDNITRKFREFLLFGHKKDALEWAMKHGLWGHALFLASKMDLRTYANVMTRFANSLALNDPLQTLYQLMSGRQPLAVTNVADKKWGDWRPHLAMILSNPSAHPDVDSRSITTLGDTLANKGCLCAAHFCYIMAQVEFGTFEQKSSKFVLLTSDHSLSFEEFASNEAIQVTEIYEYAQSLANPGYLLVHLQFYKFLYAMRLVEHGFLEEALHYCEIIAEKVQKHPHYFQLEFISEVLNLATLLKYHDPHFLRGQGEFEDQDDPEWLKSLKYLVENFNNFPVADPPQPYIDQQPTEVTPSQNTNNLQYTQQPTESTTYNNVPNQTTQDQINNSYNQMNYYQQSGWNQQSSLQNSTYSPTNSSLDNTPYYGDNTLSNQSSFNRQNSIPSHEENETTDVPSSPVTQTPPFDYYSGGTQPEWSSVQTLPSISLSEHCHTTRKSDLKALVETESDDIALGSSSHNSTPLHNYLLTNENDSDDRRLLMTRSGLVDARTLNSCLKTSRSKHKKCIKFDATASGHNQGKTGIRRRRFSKKKIDEANPSDSSPEGSPSKSKSKHKLSLLATLGLVRPNDDAGVMKMSKRKRKAKKKSETLEKLLQSKKTFAIDEPCNVDERWTPKEKSMDESVQETKNIINILNKLSLEERKNSQLSQMMANEFSKKPPLIFGGTYPIDEPFESKPVTKKSRNYFDLSDQLVKGGRANLMSSRSYKYCKPISSMDRQKTCAIENRDGIEKLQLDKGETIAKLTPIKIFKQMQHSGKKLLQSKEDVSTTSKSTRSSSNTIEYEKEPSVHETKSMYDTSNNYNAMSERERRDSAMSSGSRYSAGSLSVANKSSAKETKPEIKKDKHTSQAGKTWLGGIFSRLLPKAPNQMILPDDKNPTIVWDDTKNCWVNKDSNDEDESNAPVAPPTDMELMGSKSSITTFHSPMPPSTFPAPSASVPPAATSQPVNKFQRPKTRGMRQNYVDVLSTSGATKKTNVLPEALFPSPFESNNSPQMFTPTPTSNTLGENYAADYEQSHVSYNSPHPEKEEPIENQATPLMFDPAAFDSRRSNNANNQRQTLGQAGRRTYPTS